MSSLKGTLVTIAVGALVLTGVVFLLSKVPPPASTGSGSSISNLSVDHNLFDFGSISMAAGKVSHNFIVKNNGSTPVKITNVSSSCMCTVAYFTTKDQGKSGPFGMPGMSSGSNSANQTIAAGEEAMVEAVFDPAAHGPAGVGNIDRFVYIADKDGNTSQFEIKATVTP